MLLSLIHDLEKFQQEKRPGFLRAPFLDPGEIAGLAIFTRALSKRECYQIISTAGFNFELHRTIRLDQGIYTHPIPK